MSKSFYFSIPGAPVGKGRPRFTRNGHTYTPSNTTEYENLVKAVWYSTNGQAGFAAGVPVACEITAYFEPPKSASKRKQVELLNRVYALKKPDIDNVAKIVLDALNGIAFQDDAQIACLTVTKRYAAVASVDVALVECDLHGNAPLV